MTARQHIAEGMPEHDHRAGAQSPDGWCDVIIHQVMEGSSRTSDPSNPPPSRLRPQHLPAVGYEPCGDVVIVVPAIPAVGRQNDEGWPVAVDVEFDLDALRADVTFA